MAIKFPQKATQGQPGASAIPMPIKTIEPPSAAPEPTVAIDHGEPGGDVTKASLIGGWHSPDEPKVTKIKDPFKGLGVSVKGATEAVKALSDAAMGMDTEEFLDKHAYTPPSYLPGEAITPSPAATPGLTVKYDKDMAAANHVFHVKINGYGGDAAIPNEILQSATEAGMVEDLAIAAVKDIYHDLIVTTVQKIMEQWVKNKS